MSWIATSPAESKPRIDGSWKTSGQASALKTATSSQILSFEMPSPRSALARKHSKFSKLRSKLESNQEDADALAAARKQIADTYFQSAPVTLKVLRMKAGLSQQALAKAVNTKQPHIANIENGRQNMMFETAALLSQALGVSLDELYAVWDASRKQA